MKILHVSKKYPNALGGDAVVVSNLTKQQKASGNKVIILTSNCAEINSGKTIYKFGLKDTPAGLDNITPRRLVSLVILYFKAFKVLRVEKPDVVHTHSVDMAFFISFAARHFHIPVVHSFHIVTFNDPQQSLIRRHTELLLLRGAKPHKILLSNPTDIDDFKKKGFSNTAFVPNGVNIEDWKTTRKAQKNEKFTFIAVGRLEEQKGFIYLIKAASLLREYSPDFNIQIVGEGSQHNMLQKQIDDLDLSNNVCLIGNRKPQKLRELYTSANVFISPSLWEAFPITLLEAWSAGLPVITTKVGVISEMPEETYVLVNARDEASLAQAMRKLFESETAMDSLVKNSLEEVKTYTWIKIYGILEAIYLEVVGDESYAKAKTNVKSIETDVPKMIIISDNPRLRGRRFFIAEKLVERGYEIHYIMWDDPFHMHGKALLTHFFTSLRTRDYQYKKVTVHKIGRLPYYWPYINGILFKHQIKRLYKKVGASLIFTESYTNETEVPKSLPFIYDLSDDYAAPADLYGSFIYKLAFKMLGVKGTMRRQCQNALAVTAVSDLLCKYAKQYNDMTIKLPNSVDRKPIEEVLSDPVTMNKNKHAMIYVTGFGEWSRAIEVLQLVVDLHKDFPGIDLTLIGDGIEVDNMKHFIKQKHASSYIHYLGFVADRKELFTRINQSHIGLNISDKNKWRDAAHPVKVLEYSALGKKVVSTNLAEVEALNFSNIFMFNDSPGGPDLRTAMRSALTHQAIKKDYDQVSMHVRDVYNWDKLADKLLDLIERIKQN